jgi:predicted TIM-barrel fold metal-dependent hydrolase
MPPCGPYVAGASYGPAAIAGHPNPGGTSAGAWCYAVETATQAIRMVLSGLFDGHSRLKIVLGHLANTCGSWCGVSIRHRASRRQELSFRDALCGPF